MLILVPVAAQERLPSPPFSPRKQSGSEMLLGTSPPSSGGGGGSKPAPAAKEQQAPAPQPFGMADRLAVYIPLLRSAHSSHHSSFLDLDD
jgi:hypothetical protein